MLPPRVIKVDRTDKTGSNGCFGDCRESSSQGRSVYGDDKHSLGLRFITFWNLYLNDINFSIHQEKEVRK